MKSSVKFKVSGLGLSVLDTVLLLDKFPHRNEKTVAVDSTIQGGGPVATALATSARLGTPATLISVIGTDQAGRILSTILTNSGIDITNVVQDPKARTPQAYIWVDRRSGDRAVVLDNKGSRGPSIDEIPLNVLATSRVFLTDGRDLKANLHALPIAKSHDVTTVMDAGSKREGMKEMIKWIDYFICSNDYAQQATGLNDPYRALLSLQESVKCIIIITLGQDGCIFVRNRSIFRMKALDINVIDTTGAGDVFHGAFSRAIASYSGEWSLETIIKYATAAAGISCSRLGGQHGIPTHLEVIDRMAEIHSAIDY